MPKNINIIGIVAFFILTLFSLSFAQEESFTITTYYPSPYGSYNELTSHRAKIGRNYSGSAYSVADDNLIVEGNVGIGTTSPNVKLDVVGNLSGSSERILSVRNSSGAKLASIGANMGGDGELLLYDWSSGQASANTVLISASGNSYFMGGNVSIGALDVPTARLEVGGQIKITDGTQGTGKVLTSDASGLASWQAAIPSGYCVFPKPGISGCPTGWTSYSIPLLNHSHSWCDNSSGNGFPCSYYVYSTTAADSGLQFMCCKD